MKKILTKEQRKGIRDKKASGMKAPITGLQNQANIERLRKSQRSKGNNSLGKEAIYEDRRYRMWKSKTDIKRSFFIWKGNFSSSPKEAHIAAILTGMSLRFYREVSFDLRKRFDFYIPLIDLVIEYDGRQHFTNLDDISNDIDKEKLLNRLGVKYIRYNKTHDLDIQIAHDLIYHPILMSNG